MNANNFNRQAVRNEILELYGVVPSESFDVGAACAARVEYLKGFLRRTGLRGFILGISGGVDSTTAGRLAQLACQELRSEGYEAHFYAVRLPSGIQMDEDDAQSAVRFINPDRILTINVGPAADALNEQCLAAVSDSGSSFTPEQADYHKGNIKARFRMTAQYHLAAFYGAAVLGSDHAAEACAGFFTKFGDGACDLVVLNGLNKTQVRMCAKFLGAPEVLYAKPPTADLEELNPGKLDDEGFGFPYTALDAFLEGKEIDQNMEDLIIDTYEKTRHKRVPIVEFQTNS